jgi:Pyruvate/2-oxoacid:ferredoxin oxidoreductase gamma subunit
MQGKAHEQRFAAALRRPIRIVIAGAAGQKVVSASTLLGTGAVLAGLWATRRDDYPVTVMTGHSISEVILSPEEIFYTGIERPDIFLALASEGLKSAHRQFNALTAEDVLYIRKDLLPLETKARIVPLDLGRVSRKEATITAVAAMLRHTGLYPIEAFKQAIGLTQRREIAEENLKALERSSTVITRPETNT